MAATAYNDMLAQIRKRDAAFDQIPVHWQGPRDRRYLLELIDQLLRNEGTEA